MLFRIINAVIIACISGFLGNIAPLAPQHFSFCYIHFFFFVYLMLSKVQGLVEYPRFAFSPFPLQKFEKEEPCTGPGFSILLHKDPLGSSVFSYPVVTELPFLFLGSARGWFRTRSSVLAICSNFFKCRNAPGFDAYFVLALLRAVKKGLF